MPNAQDAQDALELGLMARAMAKKAHDATSQLAHVQAGRTKLANYAVKVAGQLVNNGLFDEAVRTKLAAKLAADDGLGALAILEVVISQGDNAQAQMGSPVRKTAAANKSATPPMKQSEAYFYEAGMSLPSATD